MLFVYGFDWGIEGSAWGPCSRRRGWEPASSSCSCARPAATWAQLRLMRRLVSVGRYIFIRTAALMAAFTLAGAIVTRFGDASIAAHQIAFQLWIFLAFVLDAIMIAEPVIVSAASARATPSAPTGRARG